MIPACLVQNGKVNVSFKGLVGEKKNEAML